MKQCEGCPHFKFGMCKKENKPANKLPTCPEGRWDAPHAAPITLPPAGPPTPASAANLIGQSNAASTDTSERNPLAHAPAEVRHALEHSPIAPFRHPCPKPYEGSAPWRDVPVSVILPIIEYGPTLPLVLEAIQLQTIPSIIYIIDTGSILTTAQIEALRAPRIEVLQVRCQGWRHSSMPVAAALDAAWSCVHTPFAFFTHNDCFLKKQSAFEQMIDLCRVHHAVGHQITPRENETWHVDFGHTVLMLDVAKMDSMRITWNMRTYNYLTGVSIDPQRCKIGHPDTESMMNHVFRLNNFIPSFEAKPGQPLFIGKEANFQRNQDEWMDHCRSMTCGMIYSPDHYARASKWAEAAMVEAAERHKNWRRFINDFHPDRLKFYHAYSNRH